MVDQKNHPNIIYILADDMGYGDLSCLNESSKIKTTHLDKLAAEGMVFEDAHSTSAVCTPSRYSILTGRYSWRSRLKRSVLGGYSQPLIEPGRMTVASLLKEHGYRTAVIGKWHLGLDWTSLDGEPIKEDGSNVDFNGPITNGPDVYGFDEHYIVSASLDMAPYLYIENGEVTSEVSRTTKELGKFRWWRKGPIAEDFKHEDVLTNTTTRALNFIHERARENSPFFLYLPLTAPHVPILPSDQFRGKSGTNDYGDFCLQVDDIVGQIMETIKQVGVDKNTIVVFTSDNGVTPKSDIEGMVKLGHHSSYVFRGHKADIYEGGHRIPLIVKWPKVISRGSRCLETVSLSDFLATCAEFLKVPLPENAGEDSVSHMSLWRGTPLKKPLRETTILHSGNGSFSIRKGPWKLEMCPGSGGMSFPRAGKECEGLPEYQLYNLEEDIGECNNIFNKHPEVVESLLETLTHEIKAGRSTPGPPQKNDGLQHWEQLWWLNPEKPK